MTIHEDPVVIKQQFTTTIGNVWNAITQHDQMIQWFFDNIPSFSPEEGFETRFTVQAEGRSFVHLWKITEVNTMKKLHIIGNMKVTLETPLFPLN